MMFGYTNADYNNCSEEEGSTVALLGNKPTSSYRKSGIGIVRVGRMVHYVMIISGQIIIREK